MDSGAGLVSPSGPTVWLPGLSQEPLSTDSFHLPSGVMVPDFVGSMGLGSSFRERAILWGMILMNVPPFLAWRRGRVFR